MRPTLKQIAGETGLSISTVSRVLTGKGYVAADTKKLVEEVMERLQYTRKERRIVTLRGNDDLVLILVGGIKSSLASQLVEMLVQEVEKKRKRPFVAVTSFQTELERSYLSYAEKNHFYGVIALTIQETPETLALLRTLTCPVVMLDRYLPSLDMDCLRPDYYKMGFEGAEYLIRHGHRRIAFIGGSQDSPITQDKKMGFEDCMQACGLKIPPEWVIHLDRLIYENGRMIADRLVGLDCRPTAIVSSNDISVSILNELLVRGVRVPEDMSIFNCEDSVLAAQCQVPLTSMRIDHQRMSADAVKTLWNRIHHPGCPRSVLIYNPLLIERSSVCPPAENDSPINL